MTTYRPALALVAVLGLLSGEGTAAFAQAVPTVPGLPTVPTIPTVPGQERERFKVVVEGGARSYAQASGVSEPGTCNVTLKAITIDEDVSYGRGRGVTMEFVRVPVGGGSLVTLTRSGRFGDASFAVRGTIARAVARVGLVTRTPAAPGLEPTCPTATEQPAARPGCNTTFPLSTDLKLLYNSKGGSLKLQPLSRELLAGDTPVGDCPASDVFPGLSGLVGHAWPTPLQLPAERLSVRTIFGRRHSFKVVFQALRPAQVTPMIVLKGSVNRYTSHDAVVRFTRLR